MKSARNIQNDKKISTSFGRSDNWIYWLDKDSPFTPRFTDESESCNERGEKTYGEDYKHNCNGHIDKDFNYTHTYLYIEYE